MMSKYFIKIQNQKSENRQFGQRGLQLIFNPLPDHKNVQGLVLWKVDSKSYSLKNESRRLHSPSKRYASAKLDKFSARIFSSEFNLHNPNNNINLIIIMH